MDSPFVNDLNVTNQSKFESGIENSETIIARVKESRNFSADANSTSESDSPNPATTTPIELTTSTPPVSSTTSPVSDGSNSPVFAADSFEKKVEIAPANIETKNDISRKPLLADRIAEIERAALEKRRKREIASTETPAPASPKTLNAAELGSEETSLFQRIRIAYQRQQNGLQAKAKSNAAQILGLD